ncbi:hypothetical protein C8J56DRAFT_965235 [Mycena floridula]|nr:hypothetical protein C8J56DRAFT_965235 [Mycena floridula]
MTSKVAARSVDDYPSLLWITIPPIFLVSAWFVRRWYLARKLRLYGIGKGAPGFQTNVRKLRVTPEIAARLRRGEQVSPEEIAAAAREAELNPPEPLPPRQPLVEIVEKPRESSPPVNEWLPENLTSGSKKRSKKRK